MNHDIGYEKIRKYGRTYGFHNMYVYFNPISIDILENKYGLNY